jgi:tRNA pseudouridine55 synthase
MSTPAIEGLLAVDKPAGPSSHDVVARARRALRLRRIGHTGTLDPAATGVLPLVLGRATRLSRFLSGADKTYEAEIRLGFATTTFDLEGAPVGVPYSGPWPDAAAVATALDSFRGTFMQQPPAYSAKKIAGRRSYELARRAEMSGASPPETQGTLPAAVRVSASAIDLLHAGGDRLAVRIQCSAGFYMRSLAHELGQRLETGAHLVALRRTKSGDVTLAQAVPLDAIEHGDEGRRAAEAALVPLDRMLPGFERVVLTVQGVRRAVVGREIGPADALSGFPPLPGSDGPFRLTTEAGALVGIATAGHVPGLLHPLVVLM